MWCLMTVKKLMNNNTKKIFVTSLITSLLALSVCLFMAYEINGQGMLLEEQISILSDNNKKEILYTNTNRTIKETEQEREAVSEKFLKDENDLIYFLTEIEGLAPKLGLTVETDNIENVLNEEKKLEAIKVSFIYSGQKNKVMDFTKLIENIPYHSYVDTLSLTELASGNWEGKITVFITMQAL